MLSPEFTIKEKCPRYILCLKEVILQHYYGKRGRWIFKSLGNHSGNKTNMVNKCYTCCLDVMTHDVPPLFLTGFMTGFVTKFMTGFMIVFMTELFITRDKNL